MSSIRLDSMSQIKPTLLESDVPEEIVVSGAVLDYLRFHSPLINTVFDEGDEHTLNAQLMFNGDAKQWKLFFYVMFYPYIRTNDIYLVKNGQPNPDIATFAEIRDMLLFLQIPHGVRLAYRRGNRLGPETVKMSEELLEQQIRRIIQQFNVSPPPVQSWGYTPSHEINDGVNYSASYNNNFYESNNNNINLGITSNEENVFRRLPPKLAQRAVNMTLGNKKSNKGKNKSRRRK
jgi:hypothetical protein